MIWDAIVVGTLVDILLIDDAEFNSDWSLELAFSSDFYWLSLLEWNSFWCCSFNHFRKMPQIQFYSKVTETDQHFDLLQTCVNHGFPIGHIGDSKATLAFSGETNNLWFWATFSLNLPVVICLFAPK